MKLTIFLDASALKDAACRLKAFRNVVIGYKEVGLNNDTHFGTCFHLFRSTFRITGNEDLAIFKAQKLWETTETIEKKKKKYIDNKFLVKTCMDYAETYRHDDFKLVIDPADNQPLIEPKSRFAFPIYSDDLVDILFAGTMDEVAFANSSIWNGGSGYRIADAKTTSAWNSYQYFDEYILNPQLLVYRWAVRKYAQFKPDSIWAKIDASPNVGCVIDGVFYRGMKEGDPPSVEFKRSRIFTYKDWQLDEVEHGVMEVVKKLVADIHKKQTTGEEPYREGVVLNLCNDSRWGACKYCNACAGVDKEQTEARLEEAFRVIPYNPLTHGEVK